MYEPLTLESLDQRFPDLSVTSLDTTLTAGLHSPGFALVGLGCGPKDLHS